jgi:hypothetical protein
VRRSVSGAGVYGAVPRVNAEVVVVCATSVLSTHPSAGGLDFVRAADRRAEPAVTSAAAFGGVTSQRYNAGRAYTRSEHTGVR